MAPLCKSELESEVAKVIPYFPYKGIDRFYDIGGLLKHPDLFDKCCDAIAAKVKELGATAIGGFDARGFLFTPVAIKANVPFFMLRKGGKMPNCVYGDGYKTEYDSKDGLGIQRDAVKPGEKVVMIDDLIATGGTLCAGIDLVKKLNAEVVGCVCLVELKFLKGADKVKERGGGETHALLSEEILQVSAALPEGYVDDGAAH